jgi:hypothetical protein
VIVVVAEPSGVKYSVSTSNCVGALAMVKGFVSLDPK